MENGPTIASPASNKVSRSGLMFFFIFRRGRSRCGCARSLASDTRFYVAGDGTGAAGRRMSTEMESGAGDAPHPAHDAGRVHGARLARKFATVAKGDECGNGADAVTCGDVLRRLGVQFRQPHRRREFGSGALE